MMRNITLIIFVLVLVSTHVSLAEKKIDYGRLALALYNSLKGLWRSGQFKFLNYNCRYRIRPTVRKFKLKYKGKAWCPGWTNIIGRSVRSGRSSATNDALKDFSNKIVAAKVVPASRISKWLG